MIKYTVKNKQMCCVIKLDSLKLINSLFSLISWIFRFSAKFISRNYSFLVFDRIQFKYLLVFSFSTKFNSNGYSFLFLFTTFNSKFSDKNQLKNVLKFLKSAAFNLIRHSFNKKRWVSNRATASPFFAPYVAGSYFDLSAALITSTDVGPGCQLVD